MTDRDVLVELARVRVIFQMRALAAVMGLRNGTSGSARAAARHDPKGAGPVLSEAKDAPNPFPPRTQDDR